MHAATSSSPDSEFPVDWDRPAADAAPDARAPQQWIVWAELVLFCVAPAVGFCLAQWW